MNFNTAQTQKSKSIFIIVLFAVFGFIITSIVINRNIIQYSTLPDEIRVKVRDGSKGKNDSTVFKLRVIPKSPIYITHGDTSALGGIVERNILYHQNPMFPVWGMLILIMVTVASGSFPVFIDQIIQLKSTYELSARQVVSGILFSILIAFYIYVSNSSGKGYYTPQKIIDDFHIILTSGRIIDGIIGATIILMLPVLAVMFLLAAASDKLLTGEVNKQSVERAAKGLEMLNEILRNALQILSIIVVFTVLTSSALRESIKATVEIDKYNIFPREVSYVYGMYFSLFLCIIYVPIYYYLKKQVNHLNLIVMGIEGTIEEKQKILNSITLKGSALDNLKLSLTVLAPFITSFLPENLHFLK